MTHEARARNRRRESGAALLDSSILNTVVTPPENPAPRGVFRGNERAQNFSTVRNGGVGWGWRFKEAGACGGMGALSWAGGNLAAIWG